jgi:hypothetical protein
MITADCGSSFDFVLCAEAEADISTVDVPTVLEFLFLSLDPLRVR